jgi:hypothetical protein
MFNLGVEFCPRKDKRNISACSLVARLEQLGWSIPQKPIAVPVVAKAPSTLLGPKKGRPKVVCLMPEKIVARRPYHYEDYASDEHFIYRHLTELLHLKTHRSIEKIFFDFVGVLDENRPLDFSTEVEGHVIRVLQDKCDAEVAVKVFVEFPNHNRYIFSRVVREFEYQARFFMFNVKNYMDLGRALEKIDRDPLQAKQLLRDAYNRARGSFGLVRRGGLTKL